MNVPGRPLTDDQRNQLWDLRFEAAMIYGAMLVAVVVIWGVG